MADKSVTLGEKKRLGAGWEQKRLLWQLPLTPTPLFSVGNLTAVEDLLVHLLLYSDVFQMSHICWAQVICIADVWYLWHRMSLRLLSSFPTRIRWATQGRKIEYHYTVCKQESHQLSP